MLAALITVIQSAFGFSFTSVRPSPQAAATRIPNATAKCRFHLFMVVPLFETLFEAFMAAP